MVPLFFAFAWKEPACSSGCCNVLRSVSSRIPYRRVDAISIYFRTGRRLVGECRSLHSAVCFVQSEEWQDRYLQPGQVASIGMMAATIGDSVAVDLLTSAPEPADVLPDDVPICSDMLIICSLYVLYINYIYIIYIILYIILYDCFHSWEPIELAFPIIPRDDAQIEDRRRTNGKLELETRHRVGPKHIQIW